MEGGLQVPQQRMQQEHLPLAAAAVTKGQQAVASLICPPPWFFCIVCARGGPVSRLGSMWLAWPDYRRLWWLGRERWQRSCSGRHRP